MKRKQSKLESQVTLTFEYAQQLCAIIRDLESIDRLIPEESSRRGWGLGTSEQAIIEARKRHLLQYVQTICRDHMLWGGKLLKGGWKVKP